MDVTRLGVSRSLSISDENYGVLFKLQQIRNDICRTQQQSLDTVKMSLNAFSTTGTVERIIFLTIHAVVLPEDFQLRPVRSTERTATQN